MPQTSFRFRGRREGAQPQNLLTTSKIKVHPRARLRPGRARDGATEELDVAPDELVRVELENGFVLWSRADDLVRDHGHKALSRDGESAWEFGSLAPASAINFARGERGVVGLGIKVLDFFGVDLAGAAAHELGLDLERKLLRGNTPGFYRCPLDKDFGLVRVPKGSAVPIDKGPLLVFLHGTASCCDGSFGKLWEPGNREGRAARERLFERYGDRSFALEHCTLTKSPIENALELATSLPNGAELHLVSHSRGGLIGELLCLGSCDGVEAELSADRLEKLFAADRTVATQLGLAPLDTKAAAERDKAYDADRDLLTKLLKELKDKFRITRFVRVACPARGTTLASGRLDRWLSALDFVATKATGNALFGGALDFMLAVVKERTDPRTLPGLEAMMPGSALTRLLNNSDLSSDADLTVISGDVEGDSLWQKIKLLATDWFYGADHDLVVNTGSMSGGLRRVGDRARFRRDQGGDVNHFSYFRNDRSIRWLLAGLMRADEDEAGFMPLVAAQKETPAWRGAVARSQTPRVPRPLAIVLPGTMGTHLDVGKKPVWLNYLSLLRGGLMRLGRDEKDIVVGDVLDSFYGPMLEFLARTHRVEVFGYDWRQSVRTVAEQLTTKLEALLPQAERENRPVHIVAHSMGGLVVRAMMSDGGRGAAVWQRIVRLPNSRFLMLGTPNFGSYGAVRWLTGSSDTAAKLALLDFTSSVDNIVNLVREFPGLIELLPFDARNAEFAEHACWQKIKGALEAEWGTVRGKDLLAARETWRQLSGAPGDPRYMCYVAGCNPETVIGYELNAYDDPRIKRQRLDFVATREGDGTVSWASGKLTDVPMWYVEDTAHDELCTQARAFPAYLELLQTGATTRLRASPPTRARDAGEPEHFIVRGAPPTDGIPSAEELDGFGFGGGLRKRATQKQSAVPMIEVSICHGDLAYARHPVLVGHYHGDTIVNAERQLDIRLQNALSQRHDLDIYPGQLGTHAVFVNTAPFGEPAGAIVVGIGQVGELTPSLLEAGVRAALLDYAVKVASWPDDRFGPAGAPRKAAVTCLLVGSGAGGMPVRDSIDAMLRGAVAANSRLVAKAMDQRVTIDKLEFLELFQDVAITAAEQLERVLRDDTFANSVRWSPDAVVPGHGGLRRVRFGEAPGWWHRMEIIEEPERPDTLRFIASTDRARAEETLSSGQLALAESFILQASSSSASNPDAAKTLFEMLLPLRLKEMEPQQGNLVLLVDERSARFPWELLQNRWSVGDRPPAVKAGLIRQLKTTEFRPRPAHSIKNTALIVGNPDLDGWEVFPDLPGARREAQKVDSLLRASGYEVTDCIDAKTDDIVQCLHREAWRILHLAGHGEHEFMVTETTSTASRRRPQVTRPISGMVIGRNTLLTPGDVEQMRWVPELVFINCCHLGKTLSSKPKDRAALAANLGVQFIRMGVRAVVAAGWAVDDEAASKFAEVFYSAMLAGDQFGDAVRAARESVWGSFAGVSNTWGAYQCYGDQSYRLERTSSPQSKSKSNPFHLHVELIAELENLAGALRAHGADAQDRTRFESNIAALLERIPESQRENWSARADVCAALGIAWGEARYWTTAIESLERAIAACEGDCPVRAVEQCANFRVRQAAEEWMKLRDGGRAGLEEGRKRLVKVVEQAVRELQRMRDHAETEERLSLLGGAFKRLVVLQTEAEQAQTLREMVKHYSGAFELGKRKKPYAFTNWACAKLLLRRFEKPEAGNWQSKLEEDAVLMSTTLAEQLNSNPKFWDSVSLADLDLVRLLMRYGVAPSASRPGARSEPVLVLARSGGATADKRVKGKRKTTKSQAAALSAEGTELLSTIRARYLGAIRRGASPREIGSVVEHLDFIIELSDPSAALTEALRGLRKDLAD